MHRIILMLCLLVASRLSAETQPIDYQKLDFTIHLKSLRAGNHDESGMNQYFFEAKLYGMPILKEDVKKPLAERKKVEREIGLFAEIPIESLKFWAFDKKSGVKSTIAISGDAMRALVAEVMSKFKVAEDATTLTCVVTMYEKNKKFGFFGQDTKVGEISYILIPETLPHVPQVENRVMSLSDDKGTFVELSFEFKSLEKTASAAETPAEARK